MLRSLFTQKWDTQSPACSFTLSRILVLPVSTWPKTHTTGARKTSVVMRSSAAARRFCKLNGTCINSDYKYCRALPHTAYPNGWPSSFSTLLQTSYPRGWPSSFSTMLQTGYQGADPTAAVQCYKLASQGADLTASAQAGYPNSWPIRFSTKLQTDKPNKLTSQTADLADSVQCYRLNIQTADLTDSLQCYKLSKQLT